MNNFLYDWNISNHEKFKGQNNDRRGIIILMYRKTIKLFFSANSKNVQNAERCARETVFSIPHQIQIQIML